MIQTPNSASQYQANILAALQATGITNTSPGAKAHAFGDTTGDQVSPSFRNQKHLARAGQTKASTSMIRASPLPGTHMLLKAGKLEWSSPSCRTKKASRAHTPDRGPIHDPASHRPGSLVRIPVEVVR